MTSQTLRYPALAGAIDALRGFVQARLVAPILRRVEERRQYEAMAAMDDHLLRDLGIARDEIENVFRHGRTFDR